jgi:hypothetical protein
MWCLQIVVPGCPDGLGELLVGANPQDIGLFSHWV